MAQFSDEAWSTPESELGVGEFCSVCLIDANPKGEEKIKARCYLPIRKKPGGPIYKAALRAAAGGHGIFRVQGVSAELKRKAARTLVGYMRQAGIEVASTALLRLAGMKAK